jgi:outer membrane protein TolC
VFDGGRNRANLEATEARVDQARSSYHTTVLTAFREVEDALSDLRTLAAERDATQRAIDAANDTARLAQDRYRTGITGYLDVVDAQRTVCAATIKTTP